MGVDISFHIEVRCRDKWRSVTWQTPMELKSYLYKDDEEKEREMLSHMLQSRDYQMVKQLNRIERYVKKKPLAKKESEAYCPYEERTIKEIYDDFQDEYWLFLRLLMAVWSFLDGAHIYADGDKVRILYAIC